MYEAVPFSIPAERANVVSEFVWSLCAHESIFTDYERVCPTICRNCELCAERYLNVARMLAKTDTMSWEVWRFDDDPQLAGAIYLTKVRWGCDATAHYCFFDGKLRDKTQLMNEVLDWCFADHEEMGWKRLQRVTIEVPLHAFALVRHAQRHLGFGGPYTFKHKGSEYQVEGVKRNAIMWRDEPEDVLVLGKLNSEIK